MPKHRKRTESKQQPEEKIGIHKKVYGSSEEGQYAFFFCVKHL